MNEGAARLLTKLRTFVESCTDDERELLAVLLGPGLNDLAGTGDDVHGYAMLTSAPQSLADALAEALKQRKNG
jgi:hypothetical protein